MTFSTHSGLAARPRGKSREQTCLKTVQRRLQDGLRARNGKTRLYETTTVVRYRPLRAVAPSLSLAPGASGMANSIDSAQMDRLQIFPQLDALSGEEGGYPSPSVLLIEFGQFIEIVGYSVIDSEGESL